MVELASADMKKRSRDDEHARTDQVWLLDGAGSLTRYPHPFHLPKRGDSLLNASHLAPGFSSPCLTGGLPQT